MVPVHLLNDLPIVVYPSRPNVRDNASRADQGAVLAVTEPQSLRLVVNHSKALAAQVEEVPGLILLFHGSTVAMDGNAYLFTARSGTGKSTHTRLWREAFGSRAVMVNDDKPFLKFTPGGIFACGSPWSGKHGLDSNITAPLQGICILERGAENRIRPANAQEVLPMLYKQANLPLDPQKLPQLRRLVEKLSQQIPLWQMECTKDPAAAQVAFDAMHP